MNATRLDVLPLPVSPPAPMPPRVQEIITLVLAHQALLCHITHGTLVFQFTPQEIQAKVTYNLS